MDKIVKITKQHLTISRKESELEKYLALGWKLVEPVKLKKPKAKKEDK